MMSEGALEMKTHILTCLGALLEHKASEKSFNHDDCIFFRSVMSICSAVSKRFSNDGKEFLFPSASPVDVDIAIALLYRGDDRISRGPERESSPKKCNKAYVYAPNFLYWAAITEYVNADAFDELLRRDIATEALPVDKVSVVHVASATKHNNIKVLERIKAMCPNFAGLRDIFGNHALHYAAKYTESVEMLRYLIEANPSILEVQDCDGNTPLHLLVNRHDADAVLEGLLQCSLSFPFGMISLLIKNSQGMVPLQVARALSESTNNNRRVIRQLLLAVPGMLTNDFTLKYFVHRAYPDRRKLQEVLSVMVSAHEALSKADGVNYFLTTDSEGNTLLNAACVSYATGSEVIKQILLACPEAAAVGDKRGCFPLSHLVNNYDYHESNDDGNDRKLFSEAISLVFGSYPAAVQMYGGYLLHQVTFCSSSLAVIKDIYEAEPEAISEFCGADEGTPLWLAAGFNSDIRVIEFLFSKYPEAIRLKNEGFRSQLPLHVAVEGRSFDVVETVYALYPDAIRIPDSYGRIPLHAVIYRLTTGYARNASSAGILRFLLKHYPAAAAIRDNEGKTPYALAVARQDVPSPLLRQLLRAAPEQEPLELRRLNYEDRRGAIYLLFAAKFPSRSENTVWQRLRARGDLQLLREVV
jgi:ankyrin repeat protein